MIEYLARRIATSIVVLLGISLLSFVLLHLIPGSPGRAILGPRAPEVSVAAFNRAQGYDDPVVVQYVHYLDRLAHGDLGFSYHLNQSVGSLLATRAPQSAFLSGSALVIALLIAIPLGIFQAVRRNSVADQILTSLAFVGYSLPSYLIGLVLIWALAIYVPILPAQAPQGNSLIAIVSNPAGLVLPIATLSAVTVASFSRYMRSSALDTLAQDYIRTAKAKGLSMWSVLLHHVVRNSSIPIITLIGLSVPNLLAGNLIAETVFNVNGLGLMFFNSLSTLDYPVLLAYTLIGAVLTVVGNLAADIATALADPRVRRA